MPNTTWGPVNPLGVAAGVATVAVGYLVLTRETPKQRAKRERDAAAQRKRDARAEVARRRVELHAVNRAQAHQIVMQRKARRLGFA